MRRRSRWQPGTALAVAWLLALVVIVFLVRLRGADPLANDYAALSQPPGAGHLFGTDNLGRDVFTRTMYGVQSSALVAALALVVGGAGGMVLGVMAGSIGGWVDGVILFLTDFTMAVPGLLIVATVVALRGPSLLTIGVLIGVLAVPVFTRITRAAASTVAGEPYVVAARTLGAPRPRVLATEVLPGVFPIVWPYLLTMLAVAVITEGTLSFIGFGLRPPQPSLGSMIAEGRTQLDAAPWVTFAPAAVLCVTILALNVLAERQREDA